ncbi:uncharacterized protein LOC133531867 [Cydia pomonella]|uniref:uncharacterized protein LOC133531867 n=1 Tax=Cydia pomonella TaxID=82600 RepID=UPI002ADD8A0E|nr:uncharacterized protein LOC133531867 [Cydia pomonella]
MCELQARSGASERRSERRSERSERRKGRPSERERRTDKRNERGERRGQESGRTSSESTEFSSSSSSVDALKRRTSECRTYKIIMSKLDELNRLFVARRSPGAAGALAPGALGTASLATGALGTASLAPGARGTARGDSSVTVSDKVVGTDSPQHGARQKTETDHNRTIIVAAAAVDIPPTPRINVVTESVVRDERDSKPASEKGMPGRFHLDDPVRVSAPSIPDTGAKETSASERDSEPASEKGMPGRFHLDDPVRLYQQAKRLEARVTRRSSSDSPDSGRDSSSKGSSQGSGKGSRSPSLCALCRCYWLVARRYVAQLNPVRE